jgi:hypothetical protein
MADVSKEIALEVSLKDSTGEGTKSAKQRLREMQKELIAMAEAGQQGTDAFKNLERQAGKLKDEISDINQRIKNLASDTKRIDSVVSAIQGVAAGFQIAQGAAALFGDENEDLQKALVKVQGAMAISTGVQQVANLLQKESAVMMGLNTIATNAHIAAQKIFAIVVGTSTGAMRTFRIALAATGVGAIVLALGLAAEAMGLFGGKTKEAVKSQKDLTKSLTDTNYELERQLFLEKGGSVVTQANLDIAKSVKERASAEAALNTNLDNKNKLLVAGFKATDKEIQQQDQLILASKNAVLQIDIDIEKNKNIIKDYNKNLLNITNTKSNEIQQILKKYADEAMLQKMGELRRELTVIDLKYAADLAKLKKHGQDTANLEAVIRQEKLNKEKEFSIQLRNVQQERADKQKEADDKTEQDNIARMQREANRRKKEGENALEGLKKRLEDEKFIEEQKVKLASDGFNAIGELANAFAGSSEASQRRAFNINKAAGIAQAIVDTYAAAQGAYKSQLTVPDPSAPIRASIAAGIAIAQGLARVAVISKTQFKATGSETTSPASAPSLGGAGGTAPSPSFANPQTTLLGNQGQPLPQPQNNQPMRAYVVERDIQQTTSRVRRLSEFATFG